MHDFVLPVPNNSRILGIFDRPATAVATSAMKSPPSPRAPAEAIRLLEAASDQMRLLND
jgi:hypothetical protein